MAYINLLPWREKLRLKNNKQFIKLVYITLALGAAIISSLVIYLKIIQNNQLELNQKLETDNLKLMSRLQNDTKNQNELKILMSQIELLSHSFSSRKVIVQIWNLVANTLPNSIHLTGIQKIKDSITFEGVAVDATAVSLWVSKLEDSQNLQSVQIVSIKQMNTSREIKSPNLQSSRLNDISQETIDQSTYLNTSKNVNETSSANEEKINYSAVIINNLSDYEFIVTAEVVGVSELDNQKFNQYQTRTRTLFSNQSKKRLIERTNVRPNEQSSFFSVLSKPSKLSKLSKIFKVTLPTRQTPYLTPKATLYLDNNLDLVTSHPYLFAKSSNTSFNLSLEDIYHAKLECLSALNEGANA